MNSFIKELIDSVKSNKVYSYILIGLLFGFIFMQYNGYALFGTPEDKVEGHDGPSAYHHK